MVKRARKLVANNKKARHDFFIEEVYEAGIVLTGTEIKSVRQGKVSIKESFAKIENGEMIIYGMKMKLVLFKGWFSLALAKISAVKQRYQDFHLLKIRFMKSKKLMQKRKPTIK